MVAYLQIIGGLLLLFFGGEALVRGAVAIARILGIPTLIIGLTIVAMGTSAPELMVSVQAAFSDHPDIATGNIIGSNISNALLILGVSAVISPVLIDKTLNRFDMPAMLFVTVLFILFSLSGQVALLEGGLLLLCLTLYLLVTLKRARKEKNLLAQHQTEEIEEQIPVHLGTTGSLLVMLAGLAMLVFGADILVEGASAVARLFGISEGVIAVTIVAIGSSAPELATCAVAAIRKHSDIAMGNVLGSNIFNITGGIGLAALISPLQVNSRFLSYDLWILLVITVILVLIARFSGKISRLWGALFLTGYVLYVLSQFTTG